jgi:hypothetical protein
MGARAYFNDQRPEWRGHFLNTVLLLVNRRDDVLTKFPRARFHAAN